MGEGNQQPSGAGGPEGGIAPLPPPRALTGADEEEVARIELQETHTEKPLYWQQVFDDFLGASDRNTFGVGVPAEGGRLAGYLFGEVRSFEFGSKPCGWVFALGVDDDWRRRGVASALFEAALERFRALGVTTVRTMVRRNDVPVLSFFRASRFVGGPYVQLEREIGD